MYKTTYYYFLHILLCVHIQKRFNFSTLYYMLLCYLFSVNIVLLFTQFILRENNNSWTPCRPSLKPKLPMFWPRNTHKSHYSLLPDLKILHRLHIVWFVGHLAARFIICSVLLQQMCSFLSIMFSGAKVHRLSEGYSNIFYHTNIIKVVTKKKKKRLEQRSTHRLSEGYSNIWSH